MARMGGQSKALAAPAERACLKSEAMNTPSPFLLLSEVAEYTRAPISSVRHWIATGRLASARVGRRRLVRLSDLEAFIVGAGRDPGDPARSSEK